MNLAPEELEDGYTAAFLGLLTDFVDRAEAFIEQNIPITGMVNYRYQHPSGVAIRLRVGPSYWLKTGDSVELETFLLYGLHAGYESEKFSIGGGFTGRKWLSPGEEGFNSTFHQLGFGVSYQVGRVRPGLYLRQPFLPDLEDSPVQNIDYVAGLNLSVQLN